MQLEDLYALGIEGKGWGLGNGGEEEYDRLEDRKKWGSNGVKAFPESQGEWYLSPPKPDNSCPHISFVLQGEAGEPALFPVPELGPLQHPASFS